MAKLGPKMAEEKFHRIVSAWENLCPSKTFGGMTLLEFKTHWNPSADTRSEVARLEALLSQAISARDTADSAALIAADRVVRSVRADDSVGGDDGALYEAMGFVRKSKRKTGTTRKKKSK